MRIIFTCFILAFSFVSYSQITSSSFSNRTDFTLAAGASHVQTADLDGDGKLDVVVTNETNFKVSFFRNTSTATSISFATRIDSVSNAQSTVWSTILHDLDGDGKKDVIVAMGFSGAVKVWRNTSTVGAITLAAPQYFNMGSSTYYAIGVACGDLDADGKPDLVVSNHGDYTYTILRNNSTPGNIAFNNADTRSSFSTDGRQMFIVDLDNDGKNDLVRFSATNHNINLLKNTTTTVGNITLSPAGTLSNDYPFRGDIADADGDGKIDLIATDYTFGYSTLYTNTSTVGTISFSSTLINFQAPTSLQGSMLKDLDNDGKPEVIQSYGTGSASKIGVYKNYCTTGSVTAQAFSPIISYTSPDKPLGMAVTDLNGDGLPEIICANATAGNISVYKNAIKPSDGMVAYYQFNNNAADSSGYENHATKYTGVTAGSDNKGQSGSAYYFDGTSSAYVQAPASASLNTATMTNFFASAWINPASGVTGQPNGTVWILLQANNTNYSFLHHLNTNRVSFQNFNGVSLASTSLISKTILSRDQWYHVAVRIDSANKASLFINGVFDTSIVYSPLKPESPSFTIGKNPSAGVPNNWAFLGKIDEVKLYRRYVTDDEIKALYSTRYFSKSSGNLNQLSTWGTNTDGSGTSPLSFDSSNVTYEVRNNTSPVMGGSFKIGGAKSTLVLGDGTNAFNLAVAAADTLSCDSVYINNSVTLTVSGRVISTKLGSGISATAQYIGTASPQYIAGGTYTNLVLNANGLTKTLTGNTNVTGNLILNTTINTLTYDLTLGSSISNTGTLNRISGTINGKFSRWFANATNTGNTGLFPVGSSSKYAPFQVEFTVAPSAAGIVAAEFVNVAPGNTGLPITDFSNGFIFIDKAAIDGYWKVTSSISTGTFTATETANGFTGVNAYSDLRLMRRNTGGSWVVNGTHITNTGSNSSVVIARSGLSTLQGEYGVGGDQSQNPLPVKFLAFEGHSTNNDVKLSWSTAQELNNKGFEVERSFDGRKFETIGFVKSKGNSSTIVNYDYTDINVSSEQPVYYRLRQVDLDGHSTFSKTVSLMPDNKPVSNFTIYPNPSSTYLTIEGLSEPAILYDLVGNKVMSIHENGTADLSTLKNGVYFIRSGSHAQKLVKR